MKEERIMNQAMRPLIATVVMLTLAGGAYAQSNNTLATPTTKSPAEATSGYGTLGATQSDSGAGSSSAGQRTSANSSATSVTPAFGVNNTLATPSTRSPAAQ